MTSREQLRALAPTAFASWDDVLASVAVTLDPATRAAITASMRDVLGLPAAGGDAAALDPAARTFVEQFVADVSAVTPEQRKLALTALGASAFEVVQLTYVADLGTRMDEAWRQLFGLSAPPWEPTTSAASDLWPTLDGFMRTVAQLDTLDPLTTEVVRLRGARVHDCRLCQSIRNVRAAEAGADESLYDQIDDHEHSALPPLHRQVLRLVDAMLWEPTAYPEGVVDAVRAELSDAELVEVVFDVVRNAANKVAVAFGADDPHVTDGLEYYDIDPNGELIYGVEPS